jgi:hypothetical protein
MSPETDKGDPHPLRFQLPPYRRRTAELRGSSVRLCPKTIGRFYGACFGKPSQRARGFGKDVVRDKKIVVGVLAVPAYFHLA